MEKGVIKEIIGWDVVNWARAIYFWEQETPVKSGNLSCMELGASFGGLSLWMALNNNQVLCTDINGPEEGAHYIHKRYSCHRKIEYRALSATSIPYENRFDIIAFKSILGGISHSGRDELKIKAISEVHKALKPGGMLLFAENLEGSSIHRYFRRKYGTRGWNYLKFSEIDRIFNNFRELKYTTAGFFGCMGRNESQRSILGSLDRVVEKLVSEKNRYIIIGVAKK